MTTKPRAKRFNIRRGVIKVATENLTPLTAGLTMSAVARNSGLTPPPEETPQANTSSAEGSTPPDQDIANIRRENLTGRQLRMARRVAQKHALAPTSDFDAVRLLRAKGIDPFKRANMLELVSAEESSATNDGFMLPQTMPVTGSNLPTTELAPPDDGIAEISRIQRDIVRRRRRNLAMLFARLAFFIFLPTFLAGYYYYVLATPMYATSSVLKVEQSQGPAGSKSLLAGTQFGDTDSIVVQTYLLNRDAMLRLDRDLGYRERMSASFIDPVQRLPRDASYEETYKLYKKNVKIGFDPTEGVIQMEVIAYEPENAEAFARALISYAEETIDNLSQRVRNDQMSGASESYSDAEIAMEGAQQRVIELKELYNVISTEIEVSLLTTRISALELRVTEDSIALQELMANERPNQTKVETLERGIANRKTVIHDLRAQLTEGRSDGLSLARIQGELQVAESELATRVLMLQTSLQQMEVARIEAGRQTRYLVTVAAPNAPDAPSYPRAFENTILAFFIFSGIYLMASLTASILREQITS
ncbi:capsule biosynthesis protein [Falsihalocynthiibacter sp. S25ZX9]|uniref:capsule biosynthesis protein n=1 Tax=Falsihalocynthiibacter sp. S25ZX9 TaxID=3240870 RepID=UPI0035100ED0